MTESHELPSGGDAEALPSGSDAEALPSGNDTDPAEAGLPRAVGSWRAAYLIVLVALAVNIALLWLLGRVYT